MRLFLIFLLASTLLVPVTVLADYTVINGTVNSVGIALPFLMPVGSLCSGNTGCGFVEIAAGIVDRFRPLLTAVGLLMIVIFGYRMIVSQEDDVLTKARAVMSGTIAGLIMVWLIDPFIHAFYGYAGEVPQGAMGAGAAVLTTEVNGIVNWVLVIVAALAVMMLILAALKAIAQGTSEEGIGNMRKSIFAVVLGIILLVFRFILSDGFVQSTGNPAPILAAALRPVSFVMGLLAMIGLIVVVYAGFLYVLSFGREDQATKAKGLLIRAALGVIVILVSLGLVNFVILPGVQ